MFNQTRDPVSAGSGISPDHSQCWSYLDRTGEWSRQDLLRYPIRGCYQHVALRDRAAYVMAVSDIVEPNACWRAFKKELTGREWDYEFRQLFFTWTPDITRVAFSPILTFAHRDETAGLLRNCDMWIGPDGDAHTVYIDRNVWHPFMRDRFFPGLPTTVALKYCRISKGAVVERKTIVECVEDMVAPRQPGAVTFREGNLLPTCAAVHATSPESAFLIYHVSGQRGAEQATGNYVVPLWPPSDAAPLKLDLQHPLPTFFTASERTGTEPSIITDLYGIGQDPHAVRYAQVRIS
jgi:hypothetical protein